MILTYSGVLSAIEQALWEIVEEYQEVGKFLQNLVEGQKRNMAQLERIGVMMEQKWAFEEKSRDKKEGSEDSPRESQKEETLSSASC